MERQTNHFYQHNYPQCQEQHSYIKVCVDDNQYSNGQQSKDQNMGMRFTFNRLKDVIEEEEDEDDQEFCKVDYCQIIELRNMVNSYKAQNLRLTQQSNDNLQLFNTYMQEMQDRDTEKKGEIESLKYRIKLLEERYFKSQEQLRKAEIKRLQPTKQQGVQCETKTFFKFSHQIDSGKTFKNQNKQSSIHFRNKKKSVFQNQNGLLHKEQLVDSTGNYRSLAQSIQKKKKLQHVQQQYKNLQNIYFKSLNNSPRASMKQRNNSIVTNPSKMQVNRKNTLLNALISPRMGSYSQNNSYEQQQTNNRIDPSTLPFKFRR